MKVPDLKSPYDTVQSIVYFPRMVSKIRLHAEGKLPEAYHSNLGIGFDGRCCAFLGIEYSALVGRAKQGGEDEALLEWAFEHVRKPTDEQIEVWNGFMMKRGWKDEASPLLQQRLREAGLEARTDVETFFAFLDADEERPARE